MSAPKKKQSNGVFRESFFVTHLMKFSSLFYQTFLVGFFGWLLTSYEELERGFSSSLIVRKVKAISGYKIFHVARNTKRYAALAYERSFFLNGVRSMSKALLTAKLNTFGFFFFFYGLCSLFIQLVRLLLPGVSPMMYEIVIGLIFAICGFCMLFSRKNLAAAVYESAFLRWILFDCLGLRTIEIAEAAQSEARGGFNLPLVFGMFFACLSIFIEPMFIVFIIALFALLSLIFSSPESAVILTFFSLPFLQTQYLCILVCLIFFSYVLKLICGRRTLHFHLIDFVVLGCLWFLLFGGIISVDSSSFLKMLLLVSFTGMYFVVKNIIASPPFVKRCLNALVASSVLVSVYGIYQNFFGVLSAQWHDVEMFPEIRGRVVSLFENPNVLGEFLILIFPIILALMSTAKSSGERFYFFVAALMNCACLLFTWSRGAWLGCIIATVLFLCISGRHFFTAGLVALPFVGSLVFLQSDSSILSRLTNFTDSSTSYRLGIWRGVSRMLKDLGLHGIGIGEGAFTKVYLFYALSGVEVAPHSHNLYLQIAVEMGIFALIGFLVFIFLYAQFSFSFCKSAMSRSNKLYCLGIFSGVFAVLLQGMTDYVWYNYRIFLLFWMVVGLGVAHVYAAKNTEEEMDTIYY